MKSMNYLSVESIFFFISRYRQLFHEIQGSFITFLKKNLWQVVKFFSIWKIGSIQCDGHYSFTHLWSQLEQLLNASVRVRSNLGSQIDHPNLWVKAPKARTQGTHNIRLLNCRSKCPTNLLKQFHFQNKWQLPH